MSLLSELYNACFVLAKGSLVNAPITQQILKANNYIKHQNYILFDTDIIFKHHKLV